MTERPDLERYVDEETHRVLAEQSRLLARPTPVRVLLALGSATALLVPGAALVLLLAHLAGHGFAPVVIGGIVAVAVIAYALALWRSIAPESATRAAVRQQGSYPTRAPGYASRFDD